MQKRNIRYAIFSDESGGAGERFRAVAAVSGPLNELRQLESSLNEFARQYQVIDLKWNQVRTRKPRLQACEAYLKKASAALSENKISLDVVVWELSESEHSLKQREDAAALQRKYTRLLNAASKKWQDGNWGFYPDQRTGVDWSSIVRRANRSPRRRFAEYQPLRSSDSSLIQLADLIAGMARFCREQSSSFKCWLETGQASMPARHNRFRLAKTFMEDCLEKAVPVRLERKGYFESPRGTKKLNFWND